MNIAKTNHALEIQPIPTENVTSLKRAALNKKKGALKNFVSKTSDKKSLLYFGLSQALADKLSA